MNSEDLARLRYGLLGTPMRGDMYALPENTGLLGTFANWIQDPMRPERGVMMGGLGDWARKVERGQEASYGDRLMASLDMMPGIDDAMVKGGLLAAAPLMGAVTRKAGKSLTDDILPMDEASRMARARDMGHESGFWRGGAMPADGPWYARSKEGAEGFERGDLREYSLKMDNAFSYGKAYKAKDLTPIKTALEARGYDQTAKYLLDIPNDYGGAAPGEAIVQVVKTATGPQAIGPVFRDAGFDVIDMGTELVVTHGQGTVRDAEKAVYNKIRQASPDIFAGLLAPAVGLGTYGFLGLNDDSL